MLAYGEENRFQQKNTKKQNHPPPFQSLSEMEGCKSLNHIANTLAAPRYGETVNGKKRYQQDGPSIRRNDT